MSRHAQSIDTKMLSRIRSRGRGSVFTPRDFLDMAGRAAVDQVLSRLARAGTIRRLGRGIYDYPRDNPRLGRLHPTPDDIVKAIVKKDGARILPTGAYAANILGTSDQVPMKIAYLTDGSSRNIKLGSMSIYLKHTTPRNMAPRPVSALVIQALKSLGRSNATVDNAASMIEKLTPLQKRQLLEDVRYATAWIASLIHKAFKKEI